MRIGGDQVSNTDNHKKAIDITMKCYDEKRLLTKIYYQIMRDQPSAIVNAYEKLVGEEKWNKTYGSDAKHDSTYYQCKDCGKWADKIGIAGACIKCDPRGFDGLS
jgi:hypothetical protein